MSPKVVLACARSFQKGALRNVLWPPPPGAAKAGGKRNRLFKKEYTMHKKALTVAIAGALAAPLAAQAVDFTISGHINRALFITDNDAGTSGKVKDNGSSGTRIRVTGSSEMETGGSAGVNLEYSAGSSLGLRYGEVWYGGEFGKVSVGQGDQGGEGSSYAGSAATGVWIGHGMDKSTLTKDADEPAVAVSGAPPLKGTLSNYFGSLDGGAGRNERIRYDTPTVGPISAAVSVGNGDQASASIALSQDIAGTAFSAKVGTVQWPGDKGTLSASAGVTLPAGIMVSGAWGKGKHHAGMTTPAVPGIPAVPTMWKWVDTNAMKSVALVDANGNDTAKAMHKFGDARDALQTIIDAGNEKDANDTEKLAGTRAHDRLESLFTTFKCDPEPMSKTSSVLGDPATANCRQRLYKAAQAAVPGTDAMPTAVDPSFYQAAVSYVFGNTQVGVSWYQSQDFVMKGSKGTALGIGVNHVLPKVGANVYASVQNYKVTPMKGGESTDDTVVMIGTRIKF